MQASATVKCSVTLQSGEVQSITGCAGVGAGVESKGIVTEAIGSEPFEKIPLTS